MAVYFLTNDLMFASRVTSLAGDRAGEVKLRSTVENILDEMAAGQSNLVILDLSQPGCDPHDIVTRLRELTSSHLTIVAYAPHVHESKLAAAREANCDVVLTRGQFNSQMGELLAAHFAR